MAEFIILDALFTVSSSLASCFSSEEKAFRLVAFLLI